MSEELIDTVIAELKDIPDSKQACVLAFIREMKEDQEFGVPAPAEDSALKQVNGFLVFTGGIESQTDWLAVVRQEREDAIIRSGYSSVFLPA